MIALWLAAGVARAQPVPGPGQSGYTPPTVTAETYRTVVDADRTLATEHGRVVAGWYARTEAVLLHRPLLFVEEATGEVVAILETAAGLNVSGAGAVGPVRLGVTAPAWLLTVGDVHDGPAMVLGDPTLDLKVAAFSDGAPFGLAAVGRVGTSLGAEARQLGRGGPFWEAGAVADIAAGAFGAAVNLGLRGVPAQELGDLAVDDEGWGRAAVSWALDARTRVSLEGLGQVPLRDPQPSQIPVELLAGVHHQRAEGWGVHGGVGRGLTSGVGAPALRLVVGLSWRGPAPSG